MDTDDSLDQQIVDQQQGWKDIPVPSAFEDIPIQCGTGNFALEEICKDARFCQEFAGVSYHCFPF